MTSHNRFRLALAVVLSIPGWAGALAVEPVAPPADLCRAYFLEKEARDYAAARRLYQEVLESLSSSDIKRLARAGDARCRDQLAARDFASLMPEDSLVYVELTRPGELLAKFAEMLGLSGRDMGELLARRPSADTRAPFHVPQEIAISPALFDALGSFGGAGMALTRFGPSGDGPPSGVLVIHHGDLMLLKGLLETAFQFAPTAEKINDLPTFGTLVPNVGQVTGVLTESLLIVGTGRDLVEGAVGRLLGTTRRSLGAREDLAEVAASRRGATLFAFVNIQGVLSLAKSQMDEDDQRDFGIANAIADLDSFRWAAYSSGIADGVMSSRLTLRLADGHRSFAFNFLRLPSMSRDCLRCVPSDSAFLFGMGLNPAIAYAAADAARNASPDTAVTGFDIGREIFGNIREFCVFAMPGKMAAGEGEDAPKKIPNAGVVMAVNDPARSRALWGQLLAIPGLVGGGKPRPPQGLKIGENDVTAYHVPSFGKVYLGESGGRVTVTTTRAAMRAALRAQEQGKSILEDEVMGKALARLPKDSSIMLAVHVGRAISAASQGGAPGMTMMAGPASELCARTVLCMGVGQSPNQLTLQSALSGLPDVNEAMKKFGPMLNAFAGMNATSPARDKPVKADSQDKVVKGAKKKPRAGAPL